MIVQAGSTDVTTYFALRLAADGTEATGLTITNFDLQYVRSGAAPSAKVDATALAATDSAHGDNQAIEVDATDQPGLYRVDWPDAAFAAGVREVILTVKCATAFTEHLRAELSTVIAELDGIQADTEDIQSRLPAALTGDGNIKADTLKIEGADPSDTINAQCDTALADYDGPTNAELISEINDVQSDIAALENLSAAEVNAEVDTALADIDLDTLMDPVGEPAGPFAWATGTIRDILGWVGALARNKITSDADEVTLRNDADNADIAVFAHSDDATTFTSSEAT